MKQRNYLIPLKGLFLVVVFCLTTSLFAQTKKKTTSYDISKEKVLYTVGYSHLDTEWNWDYPTTINLCLKNTLEENFYLMDKYPEYVFNFTGSRRYELMKEYYPEMYAKLKGYIEKGQWNVSGSSVDEGEVNISSSESLIRQVLYGNDYFQKEFGVVSNDYMLPDCFGFLANVPSIWHHCGLLGFSTQKLTWRAANPIPFNVGVWNGPDGKGLVAVLNATSYGGGVSPRLDLDEKWNERIEKNISDHGLSFDYRYYGVGDEGGACRERDIKNAIESTNNEDSKFKVVLANSGQLYQDITPEIHEKLPVYSGDLLLIEHSSGSLTSQGYMKRMNRKNELLAKGAENLAVIADWTGAVPYPTQKLNRAWNLVLGSQFHDILPGTSIPKAYEYAWNDEFIAANGFANVLENSVRELSGFMNTEAKGRSVVVYNPVAHNREDVVCVELNYEHLPKYVQVVDGKGVFVPMQEIKRTANSIKLIFAAKVSAAGFAAFDVREVSKSDNTKQSLLVTQNSLENEFYKVRLNAQGDIASILDKKVNKEMLDKPAGLEFLEESPNEWPAWNMDWEDRKNPAVGRMNEKASMRIVENGPVRVAIEVKREGRNSNITQVISLAAGEAGKRVEISNVLDWQSKGVSLKADFPLSVSNEMATYNLGVGAIKRGTNTSNKFEVPSKQWFDLTDKDGSYGVTILEDCKYGSDKPSDNNLRLTLLYSPQNDSWYPVQKSQDWGVHEFKYGVFGHKGGWQEANSALQGKFFNQPLTAFEVSKHKGKWGKEKSFLSVNKDEVGVMAFKKMENEDYYLIRVNEMSGTDISDASAIFAGDIEDAYEVNGQEQRIGDALFNKNALNFSLSHYTIRSFAVKFKEASVKASFKQQTVELPFNTDVVSHDKNRHDGDFAHRRSLPAEMLPNEIVSEGITFKIGSKEDEANNAVSCKGQEISLPKGKYTSVYILAAASNDTNGTFELDGKSYDLGIQNWTGYIGQHYNRRFEIDGVTVRKIDKPYVKRDNIAWFATHRHLSYPSQNEAYQFSYLYKYEIAVPAGAKSIKLPDNDRIKIMAVTVADGVEQIHPLQPLYDDFNNENVANVIIR